jgi:PAS domain S-box-containing protein
MGGETQMNRREEKRIGAFAGTAGRVLLGGICYWLATKIAWALCFPNSKVCLIFPPHAVLVSILLLVPTRHWWAYILAAMGGHFVAAQQVHWSLLDSLHPEAFNAVQNLLVAGGLRFFIRSPFNRITLRDAVVFVLIAVVIVPFGTAFWGAAFNSSHFGGDYWTEWRKLGLSNGVTAVVFVPALLLGAHQLSARRLRVTPARVFEAVCLGTALLTLGFFVFDSVSAGPDSAPGLLYAPIPLLVWAALRFGLGGTSLAIVVITFQAIEGAMHGHGPFLTQSPEENASALQIFLLVTATPLLFLAVLIEEEKRSQSQLRESELRFRSVADTAPVMIWMSGPDKKGIFFNQGWLKFTGRLWDEEQGEGWLNGVHPEDLAHCLDVCGTAFANREAFTVEYRLLRKDGEYRWLLDSGTPRFDPDGTFLGYIGSCIDIGERKQAELDHQLRAMELARVGRLALMGELAASLAHEVNNPVGAMVTNASAGQRLIASGKIDMAEIKDLLADIVADGHRAREVIEGIRNMVRKSETSHVIVQMNDVVRDLLQMVRADAMERHVKITNEIDADAGQVKADRVQLLQVLLNLTMNAFEAMSVNRADTRRLVISGGQNGEGEIAVRVRDSGPGFPSGIADQLFEPFFSTKAEGTGMGLAIARSIVEAHGGTLSAENRAEGGALFTVCLPAAIPAASRAA